MRKKNTKSNNNFIITAIVLVVSLIFFSTFQDNEQVAPKKTALENFTSQDSKQKPKTHQSLQIKENLDSKSLIKLIKETPGDPQEITKENPGENKETNVPVAKRAPIDIKKIPDNLPEDLRQQLLSPPTEIPEELQAQLNAPRGEVPEDIKKALRQPAKKVSADEVNNLPEELLE